jgi:hypothetical protein
LKQLLIALFIFGSLYSCSEDNSVTCTTCSSPQTASFEVCNDSNGNATVNGEDTGTNYDVYIAGLEEAGATCGG